MHDIVGGPITHFPPFRQGRKIGAWLSYVVWGMVAVATVVAAEPTLWKTQPAFREQLDETAGIQWEGRALAAGLSRLSEANRIAIFLDRRIDPGQPITLSIPDQPLHVVLKSIATAAGAGITTLGPVVYIGPASTTAPLATLAAVRRQDAAKLPPEARARLLRQQAWQWAELAEPRQLLTDLAREAGVSVINPDAVPHDLWPAVSLPPLAWTDRMTLLLAGFGLTFEFTGGGTAVRLVAAPAAVVLEKTYSPRGGAAELAAQLRPLVPDATMWIEGGKLHVAASQQDHDRIERLLTGQGAAAPAKRVKTKGGETLYTLAVTKKPAGAVVSEVAKSLGKQMQCDREVLERLRHEVSFNLTNVSLEYLLDTTLKPLGLTWRITGEAIEVVARE